jgi:tetratricopeptide (TPR) repeat protein
MPLWGRLFRRAGNTQYDAAIRLFDEGRYREAISAFEAVLANPHHSALSDRLARFYLAEAHTALAISQSDDVNSYDAINSFQAALKIHPTYADLHFKLGCAQVRAGTSEAARESFAAAVAINPNFADALRMVAALGSGLDVAQRQVTILRDAERDAALDFARNAQDLYRQGAFGPAADAFRQALSLQPRYADLHNQLGVTLHALGEDAGAVEAFTRAIEINPRFVEARVNRGLALRRVGREADARLDFEQALQLDPTQPVVLEALKVNSGGKETL